MSDDRDNQLHIGRNVRGKGGSEPRPKTVKGKSALNAASRTGGLTTEKKYGSANSKPNSEGQRQTKVANETGVTPPPTIPLKVAEAIKNQRNRIAMTHSTIADKLNKGGMSGVKPNDISKLEGGKLPPHLNKHRGLLLSRLQGVLGVHLVGKDLSKIGEPTAEMKNAKEGAKPKAKSKAKPELDAESKPKAEAAKNDGEQNEGQ